MDHIAAPCLFRVASLTLYLIYLQHNLRNWCLHKVGIFFLVCDTATFYERSINLPLILNERNQQKEETYNNNNKTFSIRIYFFILFTSIFLKEWKYGDVYKRQG